MAKDTPLKLGPDEVHLCGLCKEFANCKFRELLESDEHPSILDALEHQFLEMVMKGMLPTVLIVSKKTVMMLRTLGQIAYISSENPKNGVGIGWMKICGFTLSFYMHDEFAKLFQPHEAILLAATNNVGGIIRDKLIKSIAARVQNGQVTMLDNLEEKQDG